MWTTALLGRKQIVDPLDQRDCVVVWEMQGLHNNVFSFVRSFYQSCGVLKKIVSVNNWWEMDRIRVCKIRTRIRGSGSVQKYYGSGERWYLLTHRLTRDWMKCTKVRTVPTSSTLELLQEQAEHLIKLVEEGDFPHLLVYGPPGAGKKVEEFSQIW